jgi:hypothetical protein
MFEVKDDLTIYATRGDVVLLTISADDNGNNYTFRQGDVLRMKIFEKKDCSAVVMQKDFDILEDTEYVDIALEGKDTRLGEVISKPKTYWYEIELNPDTMPHTIIGYGEEGAKLFILLPEGKELGEYPQADVPDAIKVQAQLERVENEIVPRAEKAADNAAESAQTARGYTNNPPKPVDGKWQVWDGEKYVDGGAVLTPDDKADIITEVAKIMELAAMGFTIMTADGYVLTDVNGERISARIGG